LEKDSSCFRKLGSGWTTCRAFIGVRDNGDIERPQPNLDEIQKKFNTQMKGIYPRIAYVPKIITENGQQALAVIIPGSELRPHFSGLSYVRRGSEM
jgi:predicted HTH transcriptional regulator